MPRRYGLIFMISLITVALPAKAEILPACDSERATQLAAQAVYDDWMLLGLKDAADQSQKYFTKLTVATDARSQALKRSVMRAGRLSEGQIRVCRALPMGDNPQTAPLVFFMVSPITGGMGGVVAMYGAGNRLAQFGDPIE